MKILSLVVLLTAIAAAVAHHSLSDEFIEEINHKATTWKAGRNFHRNTPMSTIKNMMGVIPRKHIPESERQNSSSISLESLPEEYDTRKVFPFCPSLKEIRDQGSCGSCWAVAAVEVMTDRTCIQSDGKDQFHYSAENLLTCCDSCGYGCNGGVSYYAFRFWHSYGVVSGGPYNSSEGCQPYKIAPCEHDMEGDRPACTNSHSTPDCHYECQPAYPVEYWDDMRKGSYYTVSLREEAIMYEINTKGPVVASMAVYDDFLHYKSGIYHHTGDGILLGYHGVKILGWGVENGTKYWICANSWNSDWGEQGFFKIRRGTEECWIEYDITAGDPRLKKMN